MAIEQDGEEFVARRAADLPPGRAVRRLEAGFGKIEGDLADPRLDPRRVALAGDELGEDARVKLMLGDADAVGERLGGVPGQDRNLGLAEDRAGVELGGDEMDRATRYPISAARAASCV